MVVDSSVWIEIVFGGPRAKKCEERLDPEPIVVPTLVVFEVYRKVKAKVDEPKALEVIGSLSQYEITGLSREVALLAADISLELGLATADSLVLAEARHRDTVLLTLDNDFAGISGVEVLR